MTLHSLNFIIEPSDYFCQQHENIPYVFMGIELVSGGSFGRCKVNYMKKKLSSAVFISIDVDSPEVMREKAKDTSSLAQQ